MARRPRPVGNLAQGRPGVRRRRRPVNIRALPTLTTRTIRANNVRAQISREIVTRSMSLLLTGANTCIGKIEAVSPFTGWKDLFNKNYNYWRLVRLDLTLVGLRPQDVGQKVFAWVEDVSASSGGKETLAASEVLSRWSNSPRKAPIGNTARLIVPNAAPRWYPVKSEVPGASDMSLYSSHEIGYGTIVGKADAGAAALLQVTATIDYKDHKGFGDNLWIESQTPQLDGEVRQTRPVNLTGVENIGASPPRQTLGNQDRGRDPAGPRNV